MLAIYLSIIIISLSLIGFYIFEKSSQLVTDQILQKLGTYIKEVHVAGEMNKNIACSIEKAKRELGYNPKVKLREGMQCSIDWCRKNGIKI